MTEPGRSAAGWPRDEPWAQVAETYAAAVFLAGDRAYKLKSLSRSHPVRQWSPGRPGPSSRAPADSAGEDTAFRPLAHSSGPPTIAGMNRNRRSRRRWQDRTPAQQGLVIAGATVQFGLAAAAWTDLARRAPGQVRGPEMALGSADRRQLRRADRLLPLGQEMPRVNRTGQRRCAVAAMAASRRSWHCRERTVPARPCARRGHRSWAVRPGDPLPPCHWPGNCADRGDAG